MSIVDDAVGRILGMVESRDAVEGEGAWPGLVLEPGFEDFLGEMALRPEAVFEEGEDVLGTYHPMSSPGVITLDWDRIGSFFWHTLHDVVRTGALVEKRDLKRLATVTVLKTYHHERFHFFCDVARHLFGGSFVRLQEEALATAWSFHAIGTDRRQWNSPTGLLGDALFRAFMLRIFRYRAPGYRDWVHFQTRIALEQGIVDYVAPHAAQRLAQSGVDVTPLVMGMLEKPSGGARERILP